MQSVDKRNKIIEEKLTYKFYNGLNIKISDLNNTLKILDTKIVGSIENLHTVLSNKKTEIKDIICKQKEFNILMLEKYNDGVININDNIDKLNNKILEKYDDGIINTNNDLNNIKNRVEILGVNLEDNIINALNKSSLMVEFNRLKSAFESQFQQFENIQTALQNHSHNLTNIKKSSDYLKKLYFDKETFKSSKEIFKALILLNNEVIEFNPQTNIIKKYEINSNYKISCYASATSLPNGEILISGGEVSNNLYLLKKSHYHGMQLHKKSSLKIKRHSHCSI